MKTSELSFLSGAEKLTMGAYHQPRKYSIVASEVISRLAAAILLSPAAALDLVFHTLLVLPTFVYAIGKSIHQRQADFTLPWQHLQRVRNAIAPLLLGSAFGVLHPFAGLAMSEATDKHAVIAMLSSNTGQNLETPCNPIPSLPIVVGNVAKNHQHGELSGEGDGEENFSAEHVDVLKDARSLKESFEESWKATEESWESLKESFKKSMEESLEESLKSSEAFKHAAIAMLSSNTGQNLETPCSPIHSLSIVENVAKNHRYGELSGGRGKKEIFSAEHVKVLKDARSLEESLEALQAQEFIHKITNVTFFVMVEIKVAIENSCLSDLSKAILLRVSGLLVPILTVVDITITLLAQAFFLVTGVARLISGRGPIYTEVTTNPLMHASFLIQNVLKSVGNLIGTFVWFVSPMTGFKVSLLPANLFFKLQMNILMLKIKWKMNSSKNNERFVVPVIFGNGDCSVFSVPTHSMHKTYLIVEKQAGSFNLYWVNRPNISYKQGLDTDETLGQIRSMLDERFPFMDIEKLMNHPIECKQPEFLGSANFANIAEQGGSTNCVVSNMFGMFEALDRIKGDEQEVTDLRYQVVRKALMKDYGFYKNGFFPFASESDGYSLENIWGVIERHPNDPI